MLLEWFGNPCFKWGRHAFHVSGFLLHESESGGVLANKTKKDKQKNKQGEFWQ